ncbi:MAG: phospholipase [Planctomycetes bacterium GWF2_41_51]|nr:MAG: phospholipase [Planctomycetes bacterium GWF2_41_51]
MKSLQQEKEFKTELSLKYLLYLPKDYEKSEKWPLIIFLHGAGERGTDLNQLKVHGIPKIIEQKKDFPFVVVSPQCPANGWWNDYTEHLKLLIDQIKANYKIDVSRVYLTGLSMGGFATWYMAERYPQDFAAVAPVCGGGELFFANRIKAPVWAFHGAKDDVVPLKRSQEMVDAVKAVGGDVKFTIYPELGHNCWDAAYDNEELFKWFLSHKKQANE